MTPKRIQRSCSIGYLLKLDDNNNANNSNADANTNDNIVNKGKIKKRRKTLMVGAESPLHRSEAYEKNPLLIELVQAWPCLYDTQHRDYGRKEASDKAWERIADGIGMPVNFCKERWRNLRSAYGRSLGYYRADAGPNHLKPYYLHKQLEFLNPIICKDVEYFKSRTLKRGKREKPKPTFEYQTAAQLQAASENSTVIELFSDEDSVASENALVSTSTLEIEEPPNEETDKHRDVRSAGSDIIAAGRKRKASTASERENLNMSLCSIGSTTKTAETAAIISPVSVDNDRSSRSDNQKNSSGENNKHNIQNNNNNNNNSMLQDQTFLNCILHVMQTMNQRQNHIFKEKIWESVHKVFDMPADYPNRSNSDVNVNDKTNIISDSKSVIQEMTCTIANANEIELRQLQELIQQRERELDTSEQRSAEITGGNENHLSTTFPQPMRPPPVTIKQEPLSDEEFLV